jgi:hypothetical protein
MFITLPASSVAEFFSASAQNKSPEMTFDQCVLELIGRPEVSDEKIGNYGRNK